MDGFFRTTRRASLLGLLFVSLLLAIRWPGATPLAHAASAHIGLSPSAGPPYSKVQIKGKGFGIDEPVVITFDKTQVQMTKTSQNGSFMSGISIPLATIGKHTITATGENSFISASSVFRVLPTDPFPLPKTPTCVSTSGYSYHGMSSL